MARRFGFVGLGVMGGPMAGHWLAAGYDLTVWNRSPERAKPLAEKGAVVAPDLANLAQGCDVIALCVTGTDDVKTCLEPMLRAAKPGTLFIDHSTIAPPAAVEIHRWVKEQGHRFVDAPITGGSMGAQKGQLTIFMGGSETDVAEAMEAAQPYTKTAQRVGGAGAGQMAKMANQIAVGGALLGLCEALSFAKKAGLDIAQIKELLGGGAAGSWAFDNYGPKILREDWAPGFSIKNQRKDFAYCIDAAQTISAAVPGTQLVDRLLKVLDDQGHGEWTTCALYAAMLEMTD